MEPSDSQPQADHRIESNRATLPKIAVGAAALAVVAILGVYGVVSRTSEDEQSRGTSRSAMSEVTLGGFYEKEAGPDLLGGQWLDDSGTATIRGSGRYWLGFRASSLHRNRRLILTDARGRSKGARVTKKARTVILGPFRTRKKLGLGARTVPSAARASKRDDRRFSVFLSQARLFRTPIAVFPSRGFWPSEGAAEAPLFNWMKTRGRLRITARDRRTGQVYLRFRSDSAADPREMRLSSGALRATVAVSRIKNRTKGRRYTFGPIRLENGSANVRLRALKGARQYGTYPRRVSVRVYDLEATARR